jgi:hypothetical protein
MLAKKGARTYGKVVDPCCPRMFHPVHHKIPAKHEIAAPSGCVQIACEGRLLAVCLQSACCTLTHAGTKQACSCSETVGLACDCSWQL